MTCIEIDLEDYKDEIRYTFCENNNCLANDCRKSFKQKFKAYIDELEKELFVYSGGCKRTPQMILSELVSMYADLRYYVANNRLQRKACKVVRSGID